MDGQPLRRNREFVALWVGQAVSALGASTSALAYPLLVLVTTGSPALAGLVSAVLAVTTFVVRLPAGVVADRVDRRRLMLWCDAGRFFAVGSVAVAVLAERVSLAHILLVAVVEGTLGALFAPAEAVAVRQVVAPSRVRDAMAANESRRQVAALLGPSVGGALFGAGRALPFAVDALFTSMGIVTRVLARGTGAAPAELGLMFTIAGLGGLAGALSTPWLLRRCPPGVLLTGYGWIATAATFALLGADSVWTLGIVGAVAFFPLPAVNALVLARVAAEVPDALHGRVVSAVTQLTTLLHPVGPAAAGLATQTAGPTGTAAGAGVLFAVLAVVAAARWVRRTT